MSIKWLVGTILCSLALIVSVHNSSAAQSSAKGEGTGQVVAENAIGGPININKADEDALTVLPGIGVKTAEKITEYRRVNGPFKSVEELINVKGIGPKVLEKIRPLVRVT